jgi:hypothetical protein
MTMNVLPTEIVVDEIVAKYLDPVDVVRLAMTCKNIKSLIHDRYVEATSTESALHSMFVKDLRLLRSLAHYTFLKDLRLLRSLATDIYQATRHRQPCMQVISFKYVNNASCLLSCVIEAGALQDSSSRIYIFLKTKDSAITKYVFRYCDLVGALDDIINLFVETFQGPVTAKWTIQDSTSSKMILRTQEQKYCRLFCCASSVHLLWRIW